MITMYFVMLLSIWLRKVTTRESCNISMSVQILDFIL